VHAKNFVVAFSGEEPMKVCVDPGHGMSNATDDVFDPGAEAGGTREADVVLSYGLELKTVLVGRGHDVFMTRADATTPAPVGERAQRAKDAGCEIFVSLHLNSDDDSSAHGVEALFRDDGELAKDMCEALVTATGLTSRGAKKRLDLAVLKFDGSAVLLEMGFVSNDDDRDTIKTAAIQTKVCKAVADVIDNQV